MYSYDTMTEAIDDLKKRGYTHDFNVVHNKLNAHDDFEIKEMYRFEGPSDPADEAVVYAIEAPSGKLGILVDGYGPSSDDHNAELLQHLREKMR